MIKILGGGISCEDVLPCGCPCNCGFCCPPIMEQKQIDPAYESGYKDGLATGTHNCQE